MRGFAIGRGDLEADTWIGAVLAVDVRDAAGRIALRKGTVLGAADRARLAPLPWFELHLARLGDGDIAEREAGERLATMAAGAGCSVAQDRSSGAHWSIEATQRGILRVRVEGLHAVNSIDGLGVYTLLDGQVVDRGETVARAKITPFAIDEAAITHAAAVAPLGVVEVRPFHPLRVGAVVCESLGSAAADRFRAALDEKVTWLGSQLVEPLFVAATPESVAGGIEALLHQQSNVVIVAGSRPKDPLDPCFVALDRLGAVVERRGVPAHPGSLAWLARLGAAPIVGMPSCGLFSQATVFDLMLPRLLTGEQLTGDDLAALGHGGFLTRDMAFRFPPYRPARERGEIV